MNKKIGIVVADYDEYAPFVEAVKQYIPKALANYTIAYKTVSHILEP